MRQGSRNGLRKGLRKDFRKGFRKGFREGFRKGFRKERCILADSVAGVHTPLTSRNAKNLLWLYNLTCLLPCC